MKRSTPITRSLLAFVILATVLAAFPAGGGAADAKPRATEVGVTAKEIHIA